MFGSTIIAELSLLTVLSRRPVPVVCLLLLSIDAYTWEVHGIRHSGSLVVLPSRRQYVVWGIDLKQVAGLWCVCELCIVHGRVLLCLRFAVIKVVSNTSLYFA